MQAPRIARTAHERVTDVLTYVDQMLDDGMAEPHELREYHRRKREALATTQAADALSALSMGLQRATSPRHIRDLTMAAQRAVDELPDVA